MAERIIKSPKNQYTVLKQIGQTKEYTLYFCRLPTEKIAVFKIAAAVEYNPLLDREALLLNNMREEAKQLEEEYAKVKGSPEQMLNYQFCFPDLVESFITSTQGDRRISILDFPAVDDLTNLVPIRHLTTRDRVRVDRKTSAWMMGKFLKILVFTHSQRISSKITDDNILIERNQHYISLFDFSSAIIHNESIPDHVACEEISRSATAMIGVLGGNPKTGELPNDREQDPNNHYADHLYALASGKECIARYAHERFYALVRSLWPRGYWPFTTHNL